MPAYSFKKQFVPFILDETKFTTMRKIGKRIPRVGQLITFLTGPRFNPTHICEKKPITNVITVIITEQEQFFYSRRVLNKIEADGILASPSQLPMINDFIELIALGNKNIVAFEDGFQPNEGSILYDGCYKKMIDFFKEAHGLPVALHSITWVK